MNRPYIIVQVAASVDGRISLGPNRTMFEDMADKRTLDNDMWAEVENKIKELHAPKADMLGSNSLVKKGEKLKDLPKYEGDVQQLYKDYLPDEIINNEEYTNWVVIVDGQGRVRSGFKGDKPGWHVLHLVSNNVSPEYLAFLQKKKIPYLISGKRRVDLKSSMEKMKTKLNVDSLVHTSGGKLAGALLKEGLIDEVNIIIQPHIIGGYETPALFESPNLKSDEYPTRLELITAQIQNDGFIWLRYKVNNNQ